MRITNERLKENIEKARKLLERCRLCPRRCGVDRAAGQTGFCGAGPDAKVYSYRQYRGEEPPISGERGSGVIFFSHCTMRCAYCQNSRFSQRGEGYTVDARTLCGIMLSLKRAGCHNINLVTPSHYLLSILQALLLAKDESLDIPIVYNTSGYESREVLALLDGVVDVYLADMRYADNALARKYSMAGDYVEVSRAAVSAMAAQTGKLMLDKDGAAKRGLIIRHLVMPNLLSNTDAVLEYIARRMPEGTFVSLMSQYIPLHNAKDFPELSRHLTPQEYEAACALLDKHNLRYGWTQT